MKQTTTQKVLKGTFYNFFNTAISRIGGLIFTIIVARMLFPELFGLYNIALTVILTIATFTDLGLNSTMIRYLAESLKTKTKKTTAEARSRFLFLFNFKIVLTAAASLMLFSLSNIIAIYIFKKPDLALPLQIGAIYLFAISLQGFFTSVFYALQKINYSVVGEIIFQILRIALVILFLQFYRNVGSVFVSLAIALFASFVFLYLILRKKYRFLLKGKRLKFEKQEKKRLLSFFGWLTISSISLVFFTHIDTFMLGIFLPAEFAGYYATIVSIVGSVAALVSFSLVLLPVFTQLEKGKLERGFGKVFHYTSLIAIPAAVGLAFITIYLIQLIYGQAYVPLQYKFAIALTSVLFSMLVLETALTAIYSTLFQAKEKPKIPSILIVIAALVNVILNYIFIKIGISIKPEYGLVAVAAATLITRYSNLAALACLAKKELKMKIGAYSVIRPLISAIIMLGFLFLFSHYVSLNVWTGILMVILAMLVYFGVMLLIKGIKKEDFEIMWLFGK